MGILPMKCGCSRSRFLSAKCTFPFPPLNDAPSTIWGQETELVRKQPISRRIMTRCMKDDIVHLLHNMLSRIYVSEKEKP